MEECAKLKEVTLKLTGKMNEIYIIETSPTGFDSRSEILGFVETEKEAIDTVEALSIKYKKMLLFHKEIINAGKKFENDNPKPVLKDLLPIPRFKSGLGEKDISPEARKERENIKAKNEIIDSQNTITLKNYNKERFSFMNEVYKKGDPELKSMIDPKRWFSYGESLYEDRPYFYSTIEKIKH